MGRKDILLVDRNMPLEEVDRRIRTLEKNTRILKGLYFIRHRYNGDSVEEACEKVGVYKMVGYQWQKRLNEDGYEGLVSRFGGVKPPKLSEEDMNRMSDTLKKRDYWTTEDVQSIVNGEPNASFTLKHIRTILRKMGMHYSKPYQHDYRRPGNAEDILKKLGRS
ncbi:MAG: transposase [Candidatus Thermoplasmatota archaeon]|jgi:putative transposase|nr:transposase [Candidatus Thermoplasmatota archaeon]